MLKNLTYFKKCDLITGWIAFAVSAVVYLMTMEPTASLWDCAEFIATSYKMEVGHPPGAPLFMMIARFFTIFAPSTDSVALMVNAMSSLCSAFCILFMFWTITHLGRRIYGREPGSLSKGQTWTIMGAGLVGSLAYTFSDTFWFSAIEGEVYAMSSMFTALVVWAMLQWENVADKPHSTRWLILIAYLMGLSIGIHILNLLTIPALVFIYYFRKYPEVTNKGILWALVASGAILIGINNIIIPYTVSAGAVVDRWFVNGLGLPINSGITFFVFALFALCGWAVWATHKRGKVLLNTIALCVTVILLGYSSYASVTIRAVANPPMNSNNPDNPYQLLSLLNRDQYGSQPLLYGQWYSSPPVDYKTAKSWYVDDNGRYASQERLKDVTYPSEFKTFFPRMWNSQGDREAYESWGNVTGRRIPFRDEMITVPTFGENLRYFFSYQLNFMYWRYFLWNFVGRQSDYQTTGSLTDGNWLSGIKFIDELYLGPQDNLPAELAENRGRNKYYFLPFILGLIGLLYQLSRDKRNFTVVMWLFLMMGVVLVVYFNSSPGEPRERDYVYAGSFYAFCIWIGFGVMWLRDALLRYTRKDSTAIAVAATAVCSVVPIILAAQNWDDHDRSHRYIARDIGWNYLQSCLPNSIIMNYGDNDTFPLWYNQEVEGVRLDVKIMNMSYLGMDWYVDQMRVKSNEADPVPFSLPRSKYVSATNESISIWDRVENHVNLKEVIDFVSREDRGTKVQLNDGSWVDYIPTSRFAIPVDKEKVIASGIVRPEDAHLMVDTLLFSTERDRLYRHELMFLDLLANFNWERPLYFTQIHSLLDFGLHDYLQFDGYGYRLVPIKTPMRYLDLGRVDTEYLYNNLMNVFRYGNVADPRVYKDMFVQHNLNVSNSRNAFAMLAKALVDEGDTVRAVQALDAGLEKIPLNSLRMTLRLIYPHIEAYYYAGEFEKGNEVFTQYARNLMEYVLWYIQFDGYKLDRVTREMTEKLTDLERLQLLAMYFRQDEQAGWIDHFFEQVGYNPEGW